MADLQVLAVLGLGVVPSGTPFLHADDLGVLRGDGVFETMHVRWRKPWLLDEHLARMDRSARILDLPLPAHDDLAGLAAQACEAWTSDEEGALRIVCTRGRESGGQPTVFATVKGLAPTQRQARQAGLAVRTASLGVSIDFRPAAPWLLPGAKTLSYAANLATHRWGASHNADDVLWTSTDGYAMEAPTSNLVWLDGDLLCSVPPETTGILAGTTVAWLLDHADALGLRAAWRLVRADRLSEMDGAWLTSSVRGVAEIRSLDGVDLPVSPLTGKILDLLGFAR